MDIVKLPTQPRTGKGSRPAARLRKEGLIPAVVYGHKQAPVSIALKYDDLSQILRHHHRLVELGLPGGGETALIKEVQHDHLGKAILHVDFERVDKDEKIVIEVELKLKGTAPGSSSGVLDQPLHSLKVECLAAQVPESINVNISSLLLGQAIHVKELVLPPGVVALNDPDAIVIQVKTPTLEAEPGAVPAGEGGAEPEIVGRRVKAEEPAAAEKK
ncbi:MAG: 50S ribosomal protein L25 [Gemmataceae bacterium]|nr:50S ribosomal protein L25 [Gemmataceae bacterium]